MAELQTWYSQLLENVSIFGLQSRTKYLEQGTEIHENWTVR